MDQHHRVDRLVRPASPHPLRASEIAQFSRDSGLKPEPPTWSPLPLRRDRDAAQIGDS